MEAFEVPDNIRQINVSFKYNSYRNEVEIGLFDPDRFRGTSRFSKLQFMIAETRATASYLPGPIPSGTWQVSLGFPVVNLPVTYRIYIELITKTHISYTGTESHSFSDSVRWYSGDFHTHTGHSDGFGCSDTRFQRAPSQVFQAAPANDHTRKLAVFRSVAQYVIPTFRSLPPAGLPFNLRDCIPCGDVILLPRLWVACPAASMNSPALLAIYGLYRYNDSRCEQYADMHKRHWLMLCRIYTQTKM